jgi:hypothetical protein
MWKLFAINIILEKTFKIEIMSIPLQAQVSKIPLLTILKQNERICGLA